MDVETLYTGNGEWQYLEATINISDTAMKAEPVLFSRGGDGYFNLPFVVSDGTVVYQYPFPPESLPSGPLQITGGYFNSETEETQQSLYLGGQIVVQQPRILTYQHMGTDDKYGVLDRSMNLSLIHISEPTRPY